MRTKLLQSDLYWIGFIAFTAVNFSDAGNGWTLFGSLLMVIVYFLSVWAEGNPVKETRKL